MKPAERKRFFKEVAGLNPGPIASLEEEIVARGLVPRPTDVMRGTSPRATIQGDDEALLETLLAYSPGIAITEAHRDPYLHARRLVSQRCR